MSKFKKHRIRKWSLSVRWRDRCCRICGSKEQNEAHHINDKSNHPEQAYELENGVTLCGADKKTGNACHRVFHTVFKGGYRRKCTQADFDRFLEVIDWARVMKLKKVEAKAKHTNESAQHCNS